jgi:hypothetical protein
MKSSGAKAFERLYIPKDALAGMAPEDQARALQLQALMDTLARRAKARKEAAQRKQQNALAPF